MEARGGFGCCWIAGCVLGLLLSCRAGSGSNGTVAPSPTPADNAAAGALPGPPVVARAGTTLELDPAQPVAEASPAVASPPRVALVELFTSEGCSSCPPADRLLQKLEARARADGEPVVVLSYHVDYWDTLGWKDPFSRPESSARQRWYGKHFGQSGVYTPQLIVDGRHAFVGSNARAARRAIAAALEHDKRSSLRLHVLSPWRLAYEVADAPHDAALHLVLAQPHATAKVSSGENAGEALQHVNVVRDFVTTRFDGTTRGVWEIPPVADSHVEQWLFVAIVQSLATSAVHAVAWWPTANDTWTEAAD